MNILQNCASRQCLTIPPLRCARPMNAVLHRDYQSTSPTRFYQFSDRIEIQNPGGLYGEASPENFPQLMPIGIPSLPRRCMFSAT